MKPISEVLHNRKEFEEFKKSQRKPPRKGDNDYPDRYPVIAMNNTERYEFYYGDLFHLFTRTDLLDITDDGH